MPKGRPNHRITPDQRRGRRLRASIEELLPEDAVRLLTAQTGTYLGPTFSDVVRFALVDWLHTNRPRLPREDNY